MHPTAAPARLLALQSEVDVDIDLTAGLGGAAVGAFLTTLVVGAAGFGAVVRDWQET